MQAEEAARKEAVARQAEAAVAAAEERKKAAEVEAAATAEAEVKRQAELAELAGAATDLAGPRVPPPPLPCMSALDAAVAM